MTKTRRNGRQPPIANAAHVAVRDLRNLIIVSDIHAGCKVGLFPPHALRLDGGGKYEPSGFQRKLYGIWRELLDEWVPAVVQGEPFGIVVNGDCLDGVHHGSTTQISHNLSDQRRIADELLRPLVSMADGRFWIVRGTEAHVGKSAQEEETLAESLGAIPEAETGEFSRWEFNKRLGDALINCSHHIGTTASSAHEASAVNAEFTAALFDAAKWGDEIPDCTIRSHRHRHIEVRVPTHKGIGISLVTPGFQGKTPFSYRIAGGRNSTPQFGGSMVRCGVEEAIYTRSFVRHIVRAKPE